MKTCWFEILGSGVANHFVSEALILRSIGGVEPCCGIDTFDAKCVKRSSILPHWLRGHEGRPKADCLRNRISTILGRSVAGGAYHEFVENVDWKRLWVFNPKEQPDFIFVIMGLDCWSSRVCAMSDIRRAARRGHAKVLVIQAARECGQAQVSVFGNSWEDYCVVCGLLCFPTTEPCRVLLRRRPVAARRSLSRGYGCRGCKC